jgi:hypothetical protein
MSRVHAARSLALVAATVVAHAVAAQPSTVGGHPVEAPVFGPMSTHGKLLPYQPLKPDNFKGTPDKDHPHKAVTGVGIDVVPQEIKIDGDGKGKVTAKITAMKYVAIVDENQSWTKVPMTADLLKHEQGHFDLAEIEARDLNSKKAAAMATLTGEGTTNAEAQADLKKKLNAHVEAVNDALTTTQEKYDEETKHSGNPVKQKEWNDNINKGLKAAAPVGTQGGSASKKSVHYDAIAKRLWVTDDVFTGLLDEHGVPLPGDDALIGAELLLPSYLLVGETVAGDPFFLLEDHHALMSIAKGATTYLNLEMPYLIYFDNMFLGISPGDIPKDASGSSPRCTRRSTPASSLSSRCASTRTPTSARGRTTSPRPARAASRTASGG